MKVVIATAAIGLVLIGLVWAPNLYTSILDHSFPSSPATNTVVVNGDIPAQYRPIYGALFRDLGVIVKSDTNIKTTGQLLTGAQYAVSMMKTADNLPDIPVLNKEFNDKITAAVGLQDKSLDTDTRNKFADVCNQIATELGVK